MFQINDSVEYMMDDNKFDEPIEDNEQSDEKEEPDSDLYDNDESGNDTSDTEVEPGNQSLINADS